MVQLEELGSEPAAAVVSAAPTAAQPGSSGGLEKLSIAELKAEIARLSQLRAAAEARERRGPLSDVDEEQAASEGDDDDGRAGPWPAGRPPPPGAQEVVQDTLKFANGDVYKGEVLLGTSVRHGTGVHTCSSGDVYSGGWRDNVRHGVGTCVWVSGLRYEGDWRADKAHGQGTCVYASGDRYSGEWRDDQRWGWGEYTMASGDAYVGTFENNELHGQGRYRHADGAVFEGRFERGQRVAGKHVSADGGETYEGDWRGLMWHGQGVYHAAGRYKYRGGFADSARHGAGECIYADGSRYEGDWAAGARHGRGKIQLSSGDVYEGEWQQDAWHGAGRCAYANGDVYVGAFAGGERCGEGVCRFADGERYEGAWAGDARHGRGRAVLPSGEEYVGDWTEGKRHGSGTATFADGRRFRGAWERGCWVQSAAEPALCKLRGPGLARAVAGAAARVTLLARDEDRNPRLSGGDAFRAWLQRADGEAECHVAITDVGDGTYELSYVATRAGSYDLHVTSSDGEAVAESPYPVRVLAGAPAPRAAVVEGPACRVARAGQPATFTVAARDAHGNACGGQLAAAMPLEVLLTSASAPPLRADVSDTGRGLYVVAYTPPSPGLYRLEITSAGAPLGSSPYALTVHPAAAPGDADAVDAAPLGQQEAGRAAAAAAAAAAAQDPVASAPPAPDLARRWAQIAVEAFTAVDGAADGFDSEEEVVETPEERYERLHPEVPVVRNYEDMWMVGKMQRLKKLAEQRAAEAAARDAALERAKQRAAAEAKAEAEAEAAPAGADADAAAPAEAAQA